MMKCFNVYLENLLSPSRSLSVSTLSFFVCVCVCVRELLLLYSTCKDIRLHLKSAKHRNKYLKEFSYNMQMSTHMLALIYTHTLIHTQVRGGTRVQDEETRLILLAHFHLIFFSNFMGFVIKWNENVHKFCVLLIITQRTAMCTAKSLAWCLCFVCF